MYIHSVCACAYAASGEDSALSRAAPRASRRFASEIIIISRGGNGGAAAAAGSVDFGEPSNWVRLFVFTFPKWLRGDLGGTWFIGT